MRKIFLFSLISLACFSADSFGKPKCTLAPDCSGGGNRGQGYNVLTTDGRRGYSFDSGQCYRCNWGPNKYECPAGTVVAIVQKDYYKTGEIKSLFTCSDTGTSNDDWMPTNPTVTCDPNIVDIKGFAKKMGREGNYITISGVDHTSSHIVLGGGSKTGAKKDSSGDNLIISSGSDACLVYLCEKGYKANDDHTECVREGGGNGGRDNNPCDQAGYERATKDYDLRFVDCDGNLCTPIKKDGCYPTDMLDCARAAELGDPANWNGKKCNCGDRKVWSPSAKRCTGGGSNVCAQLKSKGASDERLACCYAGSDTMWIGGDKDTDPKLCICVYPKTKTQNPALEWFYDAVRKSGYCKSKDGGTVVPPVVTPEPDEKECRYKFHGEFKCSNGTHIRRDYEFILSKEDLKNMTCEKFQETYRNDARGIENLFWKLCKDPQYTEQIELDAATKRAISNINSFFDMSESNRNVWRDEEGQFNTARLASDATAGVVLGTVGGIVSAKIIKKKQLEKGFDVLHCTVGGQKMADYGDTFQVSYQR